MLELQNIHKNFEGRPVLEVRGQACISIVKAQDREAESSPPPSKVDIHSIGADMMVGANVVKNDNRSVGPWEEGWAGQDAEHPIDVDDLLGHRRREVDEGIADQDVGGPDPVDGVGPAA